jgi:SET domain-containing protein
MARTISPQHTKYLLSVRRSPIHSLGVFALETIPRGKRIIEYTGERLTVAQVKRRFRRNLRIGARRKNAYFARVNRRWIVDGAVGGTGAELINHSCDPNILARRNRGQILYFSRRTIRTGEELTVDYHYEKDESKTPCRCGSPKCRGTMNRA